MTGIIRKVIDDTTPPDAEVRRDGTKETDWFPIFRSGKYPQGTYTRSDVDEIVEEAKLSGRRPPMVFDHLTPEDFGPNAKPGAAAGFLIDFRAVDSTDSRYPNSRVLEARAKAGWSAVWGTREGGYRNISVGLYRAASPSGKKMLAVHHLALLGAAPPQVNGLPEVLFSERNSASALDEILFFSIESEAAGAVSNPNPAERGPKVAVETISFSEHRAELGRQEADLKLAHSTEVNSFKEQIASFKAQAETAKAEADAAKAEAETAKAELETVKASIPVAEEAAKQEGVKEGIEQGKAQAERLFSEKNAQRELEVFCEDLRKQGKLTEQELKGDGKKPAMSARLFAMPEEVREEFKALLSSRTGVVAPSGEKPENFRGEQPESTDVEAEMTKEAQELVRQGKFSNFRESYSHVKATHKKSKEQ